MKLIKPSFEFELIDREQILKNIERAGRTCYKSEDKITEDSASKFVRAVLKRGHESVVEHEKLTCRVICDRGVTHEIVRHRLASYSQESTRYCNYAGEVVFVVPPWVNVSQGEYNIDWNGLVGKCDNEPISGTADSWWFWHCAIAERDYKKLLDLGWSPQKARSVLPNSLKTEIVITMNMREWRHFFKLRALGATGAPHPQMLEIAKPMYEHCLDIIPELFEDLNG